MCSKCKAIMLPLGDSTNESVSCIYSLRFSVKFILNIFMFSYYHNAKCVSSKYYFIYVLVFLSTIHELSIAINSFFHNVFFLKQYYQKLKFCKNTSLVQCHKHLYSNILCVVPITSYFYFSEILQ